VDLVPARQLLVRGRAEGDQPAALAQQAVRAVKHGTADRVDDDVCGRHGPRVVSGREALTLAEVKIAALVAGGDSTSDIARGVFLSRRTVRTSISRILTKLGATSRVEIAGEALRQGISPERGGRPVRRRESVVT
jgi:DNA-binding CsgD family transcriptional regulator